MSKSKFSPEQVQILLSNSNIDKCSNKAITYNKDFKAKAVKQYNEDGKTAVQIFREAGFDLEILSNDTITSCLVRWRRIYKLKGNNGLLKEARGKGKGGGRPRGKWKTEIEKIRYLEAKVAYLKAENDFLVKLRAKRRE